MTDTDARTLQLFYAALMVDAASNFEHFGVAAQVAEKKSREQALAAPSQLAHLGVGSPRDLFERFSAVFGCAQWSVSEGAGGSTVAETRPAWRAPSRRSAAVAGPARCTASTPFEAWLRPCRPRGG